MNRKVHKFSSNMEILPPLPQRFTIDDWHLNNQSRLRSCQTHCKLVESIIEESDRVCNSTCELIKNNKLTSDYKLEEKLSHIKFCREELLRTRKETCLEIDGLLTYKTRLIDALSSIRRNALLICQKCLIAREHRLGIDLTIDEVEKQLRIEHKVIQGVESTVVKTLEKLKEQIRVLKSSLYFIDKDLNDKDDNYRIDRHNKLLKETSMNLSVYHGAAPLDPSTITIQEWELQSHENILEAMKQINSGKILRNYIDTILKQIVDDLNSQVDKTNEAFDKRICETKEIKSTFETQHADIIKKVNEMSKNINRLEVMIAEKEGFIALAHTRLGNRCKRRNLEMTRDNVEEQLVHEVANIRDNVEKLQQTLCDAQASLRCILKMQIQLEEDINVKVNTLKIDEVECMTMRQSLNFNAY